MSFKKLQMQAPNPIEKMEEKADEMNDMAQIFNSSNGSAPDAPHTIEETAEKPNITEDKTQDSVSDIEKAPKESRIIDDLTTGGTAPDAQPPILMDI